LSRNENFLGEISPAGVAINASEKIIGSIDEKGLKALDASKNVFLALKPASGEVVDGPRPSLTFIRRP
jgi:hypothetical protein